MTQWGELRELQDPDELDADDPSVPHFSDVDDVEIVDESEDLSDPLDQVWAPELGFPDPTSTVRVWTDDEGRINKVRVSLYWKERLDGTSLDELTLMACRLAANYFPPRLDPTIEVAPVPDRLAQRFSHELITSIEEAQTKLEEELRELEETQPADLEDRWVGQNAEGFAFGRKVHVVLDFQGNTQQVTFDPAWLQSANSSEIAEGILTAHKAAYANYQPPTLERGQRSRISAQHLMLREELTAALRRGFN